MTLALTILASPSLRGDLDFDWLLCTCFGGDLDLDWLLRTRFGGDLDFDRLFWACFKGDLDFDVDWGLLACDKAFFLHFFDFLGIGECSATESGVPLLGDVAEGSTGVRCLLLVGSIKTLS